MKFSTGSSNFSKHFEIGEQCKVVYCVDLGESFQNEYSLAKIGFDTAENEPCNVCPLSVHRSPSVAELHAVAQVQQRNNPAGDKSYQLLAHAQNVNCLSRDPFGRQRRLPLPHFAGYLARVLPSFRKSWGKGPENCNTFGT